ncbi:tRNA-U20-dihydrouridine synthase [Magnetococcus marinus MC-1]|uniref:tRNA-dihydrouridine synthase B n=1 Tax=Magnetococcus marinus (strain ATCC BAA-1437 / JCM 17883 / MC-1) TaxID=156889 RepID=A0LDW2_MAGMM|nr:tRNA dihydrouridine synthase DusB [Magnetococcus marinus]ABK46155.1 tRNA-U20-dihydrouridine synthase [Magnetococcus marinus MC-1]
MDTYDPIEKLFAQNLAGGPPPLVLAPMAGVTDAPFRLIARRYGADLTVSEMIASQAMIRNTSKSLLIGTAHEEEHPLSVQIAGSDPQVMAEAARMNVDRGAEIIDINMGCPVKKVVKGQAGAALMRDEALVARILAAVVAAVPVPVTLKIRLGWDKSNLNGARIGQIAEQQGVRMLTVHGRTRMQMYRGHADWQCIASIKQAVTIPVVGNGDLHTPQEAKEKWLLSGVDGLMIGRAAMGCPWLFGQIAHYLRSGQEKPPPDLAEQHALVLEHFDRLIDFYGPHIGNRMARKHLAWYAKGLPNSAHYRSAINHCPTPEETRHLVDDFYRGVHNTQAA